MEKMQESIDEATLEARQDTSRVNWIAAGILIGLPIFVVLGVIFYGFIWNIGLKEAVLGISAYYICNISVGLGFHRLWSHASYKAHPVLEAILMVTTAFCLQGPVLAWVSDHKFHHAYADGDLDPHTPVKKGFWWAHIKWMILGETTRRHIDIMTLKTLGRNKLLMWQFKYYWQFATFLNVVVTAIIGYIAFGFSARGIVAGMFFMGLGRFLQQQATFCVNSVLHTFGTRKYSNDSSTDLPWMFILLLGENWHNYHHAFQKDYRNGHKWYQLDVHKWLIWGLSKVGLASDLVRTPEVRIQARVEEFQKLNNSLKQSSLEKIEAKARLIAGTASSRLSELEKTAVSWANSINEINDNIKQELRKRLDQVQESAISLANRAREMAKATDGITEKLVAKMNKQMRYLELNLQNLVGES